MTIARVGLIARHTLPDAIATLETAAAWLDQRGCEPVVETQSANAAATPDRWRTAAREALPSQVDVIIAFGGDGTLLDAASAVAHSGASVPVLGVNLGHLGFLAEVSRADLTPALEVLLAGASRTESRLMLEGRVIRHGRIVATRLALNDIVVTRGALSRMIEIDVDVEDQLVCHIKADGLILATATGSTAYNLSAGGPIVHPSVDAVILTPIAPHALTNRPLVLPAATAVTLRPVIEPALTEILLTFDGQYGVPLEPDDAIVVCRAPCVFRLLRVSARTHFDVLRDKLKWGY
jgi:NAD+ kinase